MNEGKACIVCGKVFINKKHPHQKVCSVKCSRKLIHHGKTMISRTCPLCNKVFQFEKGRSDPKYCNRKCANIAKRNRITKKCEQCGGSFSIKPNKGHQIYCSIQCAGKAKEQEKLSLTCLHCGSIFAVGQNRPDAKYCSLSCKIDASKNEVKDRKCKYCGKTFHAHRRKYATYCSINCSHKDSSHKIECTCETCGSKFFRHNYNSSRRYCSHKCFQRTKKSTSIELKVKAILDKLNVEYEEQVGLDKFTCDFLVENSLVIETDGTYWHSIPSAIERDKRKNKCVKRHGYTILRLPEQKINEDIDACELLIVATLRQAISSNGN